MRQKDWGYWIQIVSVGDASVSTNGSWIINTPPRDGKSQSSSSNSNKNGGDKDDSSDKGFGVSFSTRNISSWLHLQFEGTRTVTTFNIVLKAL